MTGAELARRLEVDVRSVRNYIQTLIDLGIPVEAQRGRYGAYSLRPGYKLPPLIFTEDESLALILSLLIARGGGLATTTPAFEGVVAKIERVLPAATRSRIQAVEQTVALSSDTPIPIPSATALMTISAATQNGQRVRMRYCTPQGEISERLFDPYGVALHKGFWYSIGYCHLRKGERLFRMDRIVSVELTEQTFLMPVNYHALQAVQRALASVSRAWQIEVWLQASMAEAQRQMKIPAAFFQEDGNGVLFRVEVDDLPWIARALAGLDMPFVVKHPPELHDAIRDYAQTLISYADRSYIDITNDKAASS
jgi:predicted DNA-binding transcriptional regulator YafY